MKRMKRWISLILALSLMLSACPVSVYAETGETEAAVLETAAVTEAAAESLETMVTVTEPPETPETVSEPPETTQATEPPETTAPAETTEATEPAQTTVSTEPPETTVATEPAEETEAVTEPSTQPPETEAPTEPAETTAAQGFGEITVSQEAALAAAAVASGTCGDNLTWVLDEEGTLTISGEGAMTAYSYSNQPWYSYQTQIKKVVVQPGVTSIGSYALYNCENVVVLEVPESVTSFGDFAYGSSKKLTVVCAADKAPYRGSSYGGPSLCTNVDRYSITDNGQFYCVRKDNTVAVTKYFGESVETLVIPEKIEGFPVTEVAEHAYYRNENIQFITIPDSVTILGNSAFNDMPSLLGVLIPESVTKIDNYAFVRSPATIMFRGTTLPASLGMSWNGSSLMVMDVQRYGMTDDGFFYCVKNDGTAALGKYLGTDSVVTVPANVDGAPVILMNNTFKGNTNVIRVTVSEGIETIGDSCFSECNKLEYVEIASSVKAVGKDCFSNCSKLTDVVFHDGIESIGSMAFWWCSSLETLIIPGTIQSIGARSLSNCDKMKYVVIDADTLPAGLAHKDYTYNWNESVTVIVGIEKVVDNANGFSYILDRTGGITITGYQGDQKDLVIPSQIDGYPVTQIIGHAFNGRSDLTGITIPETVEYIGQYAFYQCTGLERIQYNAVAMKNTETYNYIFQDAGKNGKGITLTIGNSVEIIPHYLFEPTYYVNGNTGGYNSNNYPEITSIVFEEGSVCTEIGAQAFAYIDSLTKLRIPASVTDISYRTFAGCVNLEEIIFEGGSFGTSNSQFSGVTATAYYPVNNATWTEDKLQNYGGTITWVPYSNVEVVASGTCGEDLIWELTEAGTLTISGSGAMTNYSSSQKAPWDSHKSSIKTLVLEDGITSIGNSAFSGCSNLTGTLVIPQSVKTLGSSAFYNCTSLTGVDLGAVTGIGASAFEYCSGLTGDLLIPDSVTSIGASAFYGCSGVNGTLTVSSNVTTIPRGAFSGMTSLTALVLGEKVKTVGDFTNTYGPLDSADKLETITFLGATPPQLHENMYHLKGLKTFYVASANYSAYSSAYYVFLAIGVSLRAYDNDSDFIVDNNVLVAYSGEGGEVVIPDTVTAIAHSVFQNNASVTKVTIPDTVTAIGDHAFEYCFGLTSVNLPANLQTIGERAFYGCNALTGNVVIPEGVLSIGDKAFADCSALSGELILPEGLQTIGAFAFSGCSGFTGALTIPDSVRTVGESCFESLNKITEITVGAAVESLGQNVFNDCDSVTQIYFLGEVPPATANDFAASLDKLRTLYVPAESFTAYAEAMGGYVPTRARMKIEDMTEDLYIRDNVLVYCAGGEEKVVIPEGITAIGAAAFQNCTGVTSVTFPDTVTVIGNFAFDGCTALTGTLTLPEKLQTIGKAAFRNCGALTGELILPDTLSVIGPWGFQNASGITGVEFGRNFAEMGEKAFYSCIQIAEMTFHGTAVPKIAKEDALNTLEKLHTVYVPEASYGAYRTALKNYMRLPNCSFRLMALNAQKEFQIENGVLLGYTGSGGEVVIPDSVTEIGECAFANCDVITKVTMPDTVTSIQNYAFYQCSKLTDVVLSRNLQSIGFYAFYHCTSLAGVLAIPDSVKTISTYAFRGCSSLTGLTLGNSLTTIGSYAFAYCTGMRGDLILPDSLTSLGEHAFDNAGFNGRLVLSQKLKSIPMYAFYNCRFTGPLTIPGCVGSLGNYSFGSLKGITSLTFEKDFYAVLYVKIFEGCSGLTEMTFRSLTVPMMGGDIFRTMSRLKTIYVPAQAYDAYISAMQHFAGPDVEFRTDFLTAEITGLHSARLYSKTVVLEWDPHMSEDVVGYTVSRDGVTVGTTEACRFTDRNLTSGQSYTYTVQGYTAEGKTTPTAEITLTTQAPKAGDIQTTNGTTKVNESSNTLLGYVSHDYSLQPLDQLCNSGTFYYELDGRRILMGEARLDEERSEEKLLVYALDWALEDLDEGVYTVVFCAEDPDGTVSEHSAAIAIDRSVPQKIASVVALDNVTLINVNWAIAAEVDTEIYRIYRRAEHETEFRMIAQINDRNTLTYADTDVQSDGIYFYYVVGVNPMGQEGEPSEIAGATLMPDTTEPVVNQLTPANGSWLTGKKTITLQAEDNVQVVRAELRYSVDAGETWVLLAELTPGKWWAQLDTAALEDGVIRMKAIAWDAAGNASRELIYDYAIDNTGPQQVKNLSYSSTNVTATLRWSNVADPDLQYFRVERKMSSGIYQKISDVTGTLGVNLYNLTPGTEYIYRVVAYDRYGNRGIPSEDITVLTKSDFTPPVITAIQPAPGYYAREIPVEITASDEHSVVSITLQTSTDRISWQNVYTQEFTAPSRTRFLNHTLALDPYSEGSLYVRAVAKDAGGNESDIGVNAPFVQYIVDRTAPAAPEAVTAEGGCGYVEISWKQGSEEDLSTYSVYRANSSVGTYTRIASGLRTVNYYDRSVQEETVYYYKVLVQDLAGNESAFSQVVSASSALDTEKPKILTIYPTSGSAIGPGNCEISVAASDNSTLASVKIEYSTDGETYITLCELTNLVSHGDYAAAKLPIAEFTEEQTIHIRASARDKAGNESDAFSAAYSVDATAPGIWSASASFDTDHVLVKWTGKNEPDLSNYQIYREEDGTYTRIALVNAESGKQEYSFRDIGISAASNLYTYKVEAVDRCGNSSWVVTEAVEIPDRQFPRAVISCDNTMQSGVEYLIDASGSTDNTGIASWFFDFGDGTTGTEPKAVHCYAETGSYTITLTVTDLEGHQNTVTKTVTVVDRALLGTIKVLVRDEYGTAVPGASVYLDLGEENQAMKKTDNEGYALFTAQVGTHTLGCIIPDNQWLPAKKDVVVTAGRETAVTMTMVHQPLIQGEFEVNRMTFEEIVAAGIDVQDPANQHMVRVNVSLTYGESQKIDTSFVFNMTTRESPDTNIRIDTDNDGESDREFVPVILGGEDEKQISVAYLDLPIGTSFLKEFFDVNLHIINNASSDFSMTDNVITLNVPEGMSLVPAAGKEDHALVKVPEIPGQTSKTVSWILRGDQEGTYQLSANYSGILSAFDEPVYATFLAREPLKVYGLSAVKLIAEINSTITNDAFHFNLALENVSDIDVNMPSVEVLEHVLNTYLTQEPAKEEENQPEIWNPEVRHLNTILQNASGNRQHIGTEAEVTTLRPGERITKQYAVYNVVGFNNILHLRNAIARIADSVGLKVEIIETDMDLYNTEDAAQKLAALSGDKKALYDYILRNDQFFYVMESVHRDQSILDSIALNSFGSAREKMNIGSYADEARSITRKFVAQLLLDASMQEAIADRAQSKYLEVAAAGIQSIHGFLNDAEGTAAEAARTGLTAYVQQADALQKLAASLKNKGYRGFTQDLLDRLEAEGMAADAVELIRQHCESDAMAADLEEVFQTSYEETDAVLEKIGDLLENWYDSAALLRDMAAICAAYEESNLLLEMLETNLDPSSPAVQEIQAIRSALESVKNSQIAGFLDQMGSTEATEETVKKYLDASFGTSVGAGYTLAKLVFGEAYDTLTWNGFSDGRHVLQLNTDLSFAMTDAVLHHGLGADSQEEAVYTLKALKYLIKLRMLGEQNYVNYCGSMSDADQAEHLFWVNQNMGAAYDSLQDYASDILALLSEYRDTIFTTYYTRVDIPEASQVTIDYLNSATKEAFSAAYEYRFGDTQWITCTGTTIPIQPGTVPKSLQVRQKETASSFAGNVTKIVIPAMPRLTGDISVSRTGGNYQITGLEPSSYRYGFANEASLETLSNTLTVTDDEAVTLTETGSWVYLAIRSEATETAFASRIRYLAVETLSDGITGTCGEGLTWVLDDAGTLTVSGTGNMDNYSYSVTAPWQDYKKQIKKVVIMSGVTSVGNWAFKDCSNLISVTIPEGVSSIGNDAFLFCSHLTEANIPEGVSSIGYRAFGYCRELATITIPSSVISMDTLAGGVFIECKSLDGIWVDEKNAYYCSDDRGVLFNKDKTLLIEAPGKLSGSYTVPGSVTSINTSAFDTCPGLTNLTIPESVTSMGNGGLYRCGSLEGIWVDENNSAYCSDSNGVLFNKDQTTLIQAPRKLSGGYTIPQSITGIDRYAFYYCEDLTDIQISENVTDIDDYAFYGCENLTSITLPNGIKRIGYGTFDRCTGLTSITIPSSVTSIESEAFHFCSNLCDIFFKGNAPAIGSSTFGDVTATAYYPAGNPTWTEDKLQNYDGNLTWEPYCSAENSVSLDAADLSGETSLWIDGVEYPVQTAGDLCYVELPDGNAKTMVSYTYHTEDSSDPHSRYPVGMKVWTLTNENGKYTPVRQADFDDILRYSGMSIRVSGKQGIRMITSVDLDKKNSLISENLAGYTLKEYGTAVAWADQVADQPLVLGKSYVKSSYAYKKGIADPVFAYDGNRMQYTNVLVGFREDQCSDDLAMRPYMILADAAGNEITLYGGIVHRSIGYIAYQNRNTFSAGTEAYQYVWDIIHNVYGDLYDEEYAA